MTERPRKKFAKPPVKVACLACRASRIRCDGKPTCTTCLEKGKECEYTPSKRGGPRYSHHRNGSQKKRSGEDEAPTLPVVMDFDDQVYLSSTFSLPGAGLLDLDSLMENDAFYSEMGLFDQAQLDQDVPVYSSTFSEIGVQCPSLETSDVSTLSSKTTSASPTESLQPGTRMYGSDSDILDAYYVFIHPYFPILPPPVRFPAVDRPITSALNGSEHEPSSPLSLALAATLALIPLANDDDPRSAKAVWNRRTQAHRFAQSALESIEIESELMESMTSPSQALQIDSNHSRLIAFHPQVPTRYESILALLVLSVYEYAQRGNLKKIRSRAGQALMLALDMQLYTEETESEEFVEARRRAWWMTYVCVCQGFIVSNTSLTIDLFDPRFKVGYPTNAYDSEVWSFFIQAQQGIVGGTQFVVDLKKCLDRGGNVSEIYHQNVQLEQVLKPLSDSADSWAERYACNIPVDPEEIVVAKALRGISRIKLNSARIKAHRYTAFMDTPIFRDKHCDLEPMNDQTRVERSQMDSGSSCCATSLSQATALMSGASTDSPSPMATPQDSKGPFSISYATNICRRAALNIAESFDTLPYSNPSLTDLSSGYLSLQAPRTMPGFACCAMQSSYAMLMLCYKAFANRPTASNESMDLLIQGYVEPLQHGLKQVLGALENYSMSFEALEGMREQIQQALDSVMAEMPI